MYVLFSFFFGYFYQFFYFPFFRIGKIPCYGSCWILYDWTLLQHRWRHGHRCHVNWMKLNKNMIRFTNAVREKNKRNISMKTENQSVLVLVLSVSVNKNFQQWSILRGLHFILLWYCLLFLKSVWDFFISYFYVYTVKWVCTYVRVEVWQITNLD